MQRGRDSERPSTDPTKEKKTPGRVNAVCGSLLRVFGIVLELYILSEECAVKYLTHLLRTGLTRV